MAATRATTRAQGQTPEDPTPPGEGSRTVTESTPQEGDETPAEVERALRKQLDELQQAERIAHLRRSVWEWKDRQRAGFPDHGAPALPRSAGTPSSVLRDSSEPPSDNTSQIHPRQDDAASPEAGPEKRRRTYASFRIPDPPKYRATTYAEYQYYIRICEQHFESDPETFRTDSDRQKFIKIWSSGETQNAIYRRFDGDGGKDMDWDAIKHFLYGLVAPAHEQAESVATAYYQARQRANQSVSSFVTYIEGLEERFGVLPEDRRMEHLRQAFHGDIRHIILAQSDQPTTRAALIDSAQRAEHVLRWRAGPPPADRSTPRSTLSDSARSHEARPSPRRVSYRGGPPPERQWNARAPAPRNAPGANFTPVTNPTRQGPATAPRDKSGDTCTYCGRKGHWEQDCYQKRDGKPPAGKGKAQ